ncbi:MAG: Na+/H+ antiporter NhaA, partial [Coriobacteriales bacterium]
PDVPAIGQKDYMRNIRNLSAVSRQVIPPATRLENALYPWVYFAVLPLFALTNANVSVGADIGQIVGSPVFLGVFLGLVVGKPLGIMLASFIVVKTRLSSLPEHVNWSHMFGASLLGGVGFTMAIFVANLALDAPEVVMAAKLAILCASVVAGVLGFTFLALQARITVRSGTMFLDVSPDDGNAPHDELENRHESARAAERLDNDGFQTYTRAVSQDGVHEIEIHLDNGGEL